MPGVAAVEGSVNGEALLVDKKGKAIVFGGAPNLGFSIANPQSPFNVLRLEAGSWPHGNEVVIGKSTADRKHFHVGDTIGVQAEGPVQKLKISGLVTFGSAASLGGATLAGFDLPTAQRLFDKQGQLDEIAVAAEPNVSDAEILRRVQAVLPPTAQARLGSDQAREGRGRHELVRHVPARLPARLRRDRALRRQLRDRQLALDHDRAAHARARDACARSAQAAGRC